MPRPNPGEKRSDYISRCIKQVREEEPGKPTKEIVGKCYGMWETYSQEPEKD